MGLLIVPDINEAKLLAAANQFISLGLKTAGYEYVNIDVSPTDRASPILTSELHRIGLLVKAGPRYLHKQNSP